MTKHLVKPSCSLTKVGTPFDFWGEGGESGSCECFFIFFPQKARIFFSHCEARIFFFRRNKSHYYLTWAEGSQGELIGWDSSRRPCVHPSTLSNMNISETSRPITTKFYLKHHWGGGKAAIGFDADQIRTLVSMATDSSHRVIMGKRASSRFLDCFWSDPFYTCR